MLLCLALYWTRFEKETEMKGNGVRFVFMKAKHCRQFFLKGFVKRVCKKGEQGLTGIKKHARRRKKILDHASIR